LNKQIKSAYVFTRVRTIWRLNSVTKRGAWTEEEEESVTPVVWGTKTQWHGTERRAFIITSRAERGGNSVPRVQMLFSRVRTLLDAHSSVRCFVMPLNTVSLSSLLRIRNILSIQHRRHRTMASSPSLPVTDCGSTDIAGNAGEMLGK